MREEYRKQHTLLVLRALEDVCPISDADVSRESWLQFVSMTFDI